MTTQDNNTMVDSFLRQHVNRQLLKYAAGSNIFCPGCQAIMDCKRTVVVDVYRHLDGQQEEPVKQLVRCKACWAKIEPSFLETFKRVAGQHPELHARTEIVTWAGMREIK